MSTSTDIRTDAARAVLAASRSTNLAISAYTRLVERCSQRFPGSFLYEPIVPGSERAGCTAKEESGTAQGGRGSLCGPKWSEIGQIGQDLKHEATSRHGERRLPYRFMRSLLFALLLQGHARRHA